MGLIINTLLFGYMGFTNEKMGVLSIIPKFLLNKYLSMVLTISYFLSFLIILLSPGNLLIHIIICLLMQFLINHLVWGIITGVIAGKLINR